MSGRKKRREIRSGRACLDTATWAALYQRYYPRIKSRFAARGVREQDADDLAQGVFVKLAQEGRPDDLSAYLATTVANTFWGHRRRRAREGKSLQRLSEETAREDRLRRYKAQEWFEDGESGGAHDKVEKILRTLLPKEAELLRLYYLEGLCMAEVARRAGCSKKAAYKRLERIIRRLRERYSVEPPGPADGKDAENS